MFDINNFLDDLLGLTDKRDYKKFPECRPWPVLMYEMAQVDPQRLKSLPKYIQTAIGEAIQNQFPRLNLWQRFNVRMQFDIGEEYIFFRVSQHYKKNREEGTTMFSVEDLQAMVKDAEKI